MIQCMISKNIFDGINAINVEVCSNILHPAKSNIPESHALTFFAILHLLFLNSRIPLDIIKLCFFEVNMSFMPYSFLS